MSLISPQLGMPRCTNICSDLPISGETFNWRDLFQNLGDFSLEGRPEDGRGRCSYDPSQSFTTVMVGELRPVLSNFGKSTLIISPALLCINITVISFLWGWQALFSSFFLSPPSDGELYSGTAYNFLGSEPIISRYSPSHSLLRTEYSTSWLNGELGQYVPDAFVLNFLRSCVVVMAEQDI